MAGMSERVTHDFGPGRRRWGHDYTISKIEASGQRVHAYGWGHDGRMIREGDYLLLTAKGGKRATRYRVAEVHYSMDPGDMWKAVLDFAPRTYATLAEKEASR